MLIILTVKETQIKLKLSNTIPVKSFIVSSHLISYICGFLMEQLHEIKYKEMKSFKFIVGRAFNEAFHRPFRELIYDERILMPTD